MLSLLVGVELRSLPKKQTIFSKMRRRPVSHLLDFLLFSNLFIAICAMAQGALTYLLLGTNPDYGILALLGCATFSLYNFSMILAKPKSPLNSPHRRPRWIYSHYKFIVALTVLSSIALLPLAIQLGSQSAIVLGLAALIAISYNLPLFKRATDREGLRSLPGAKVFIIALVWTLSCVCLPIAALDDSGHLVSVSDKWILSVKRFLFITAITIPFDMRDVLQDKQYNLKTIPVILGERKANLFCQAILVLYVVLLLLFVNQVTIATIGLILVTLLTAWLVFRSSWKKDEYYYFLFLDGTLILQFLVVFILNNYFV